MHEHSDKIQPKKLIVTIILAVLLLGYAWYNRKHDPSWKAEVNNTASTTVNMTEVEADNK